MSYSTEDIDELTDDQLVQELHRRSERRKVGLCSYCGRPVDTPACKKPAQHCIRPQIVCSVVENAFVDDGIDRMFKIDGKTFRCECGCNVFRTSRLNKHKHKCNSCEATFTSE